MSGDPRPDKPGVEAGPDRDPAPEMRDIVEGPVGSASLKEPDAARRASADLNAPADIDVDDEDSSPR